jgi:hypothetical protein
MKKNDENAGLTLEQTHIIDEMPTEVTIGTFCSSGLIEIHTRLLRRQCGEGKYPDHVAVKREGQWYINPREFMLYRMGDKH